VRDHGEEKWGSAPGWALSLLRSREARNFGLARNPGFSKSELFDLCFSKQCFLLPNIQYCKRNTYFALKAVKALIMGNDKPTIPSHMHVHDIFGA